MRINENTKISTLIAANKEAIDIIATINSNFKKLQNPFLRKVLASKVSIKDASKIGNVSVCILLDKLKQIGFDIEYPKYKQENNNKI